MIVEAVKNLSETKSTYEKDLEFIKQTYFKKEITDSTEMFHVEHEEQPEDQKFINFMNSRNENWRDIYNQDTIKEIKTAYEEVLLQQQIKTVTESVYSGVFPQFTAIHKVFIDYQNAVDNLNELIDQNVKRK